MRSVGVTLRMVLDDAGCLRSSHDVDEAGRQELARWPNHGVEHLARTLLVEAIRREVINNVIMQASCDPDFLPWVSRANEDELSAGIDKISESTRMLIEKCLRTTLREVVSTEVQAIREKLREEGVT